MASSSEGDNHNIAAIAAANNTATTSNKRKRRTEIKKVEELDQRYVTFSKRKLGLINKVTELSILCQAKISLIIISPNDELHLCGYPTPDDVIRHFLDKENNPLVVDEKAQQEQENMFETLRLEHETMLNQLKEDKNHLQVVMKAQKSGYCFPSWWELPIDDMSLECLEQFKSSIEHLRLNVITNIEEKKIGSVSPPPPPTPDSSILNECFEQQQVQPLLVNEFPPPPPTLPADYSLPSEWFGQQEVQPILPPLSPALLSDYPDSGEPPLPPALLSDYPDSGECFGQPQVQNLESANNDNAGDTLKDPGFDY